MTKEHPLRGVISCPHCKRKFTSRNTIKYSGTGENRSKKLYPYYGCNNTNCPQRVYIPKAQLEDTFTLFLKTLKLSDGILKIINTCFEENREYIKKNKKRSTAIRHKQIQEKKARMIELETALLGIKNVKLQKKYEQDRATLDAETDVLTEELSNQKISDKRYRALLKKTKIIFENPEAIRAIGNANLRQLLMTVRFSDILYYSKNKGLRTTETGNLYGIIKWLSGKIPALWAKGDRARTGEEPLIDQLKCTFEHSGAKIDAIRYCLELHNLLARNEDNSFSLKDNKPEIIS